MLFDYKDNLIRAYGFIGEGGISESDMMEALDASGGEDVTIQLQSEGGDVISGLSIYNQLRNYPGQVTVQIDVIAASIASVLAMAADQIVMNPVSRIMVHRAWTVAFGNAADFRDIADLLETFDRSIADVYAERGNGDADYWFGLMDAETWFSADEAIEAGICDKCTKPKKGEKAEASTQKPTPKATCRAVAGLGPRGKTLVAALRRRKELLDKGILTRKT